MVKKGWRESCTGKLAIGTVGIVASWAIAKIANGMLAVFLSLAVGSADVFFLIVTAHECLFKTRRQGMAGLVFLAALSITSYELAIRNVRPFAVLFIAEIIVLGAIAWAVRIAFDQANG